MLEIAGIKTRTIYGWLGSKKIVGRETEIAGLRLKNAGLDIFFGILQQRELLTASRLDSH